jgi:hypothetical protein
LNVFPAGKNATILLIAIVWIVSLPLRGVLAQEYETARMEVLRPGMLTSDQAYVDLDAYYAEPTAGWPVNEQMWHWQILPEGLVYRSYLAGTKESRFSAHILHDTERGWLWEATLGARVGLLRYGTNDPLNPVGFQIDAEGSSQVRLDIPDDVDVVSVDFRGGLPITFGIGRHRTKLAYYHLSSHVGDEFLLKNPGFARLNYSRDAFVLGHSIYVTPAWRVYAEAGWAFYSDVGDPWEFQVGTEYAPSCPTGIRGAPFFAINGQFRQEINFGGGLSMQGGWSWRAEHGALLRTGVHYYNGESNQFSFLGQTDHQIGFGVWYDF